jgi:hypothetical protein
MEPAKIVRISARYDRSEPASQRGWIVDVDLDGGTSLTVPAAPQVFFSAPDCQPEYIEKATREYLLRKQKPTRS